MKRKIVITIDAGMLHCRFCTLGDSACELFCNHRGEPTPIGSDPSEWPEDLRVRQFPPSPAPAREKTE